MPISARAGQNDRKDTPKLIPAPVRGCFSARQAGVAAGGQAVQFED
jgi:hypothetical protein